MVLGEGEEEWHRRVGESVRDKLERARWGGGSALSTVQGGGAPPHPGRGGGEVAGAHWGAAPPCEGEWWRGVKEVGLG